VKLELWCWNNLNSAAFQTQTHIGDYEQLLTEPGAMWWFRVIVDRGIFVYRMWRWWV
jgi:hypothetical protein